MVHVEAGGIPTPEKSNCKPVSRRSLRLPDPRSHERNAIQSGATGNSRALRISRRREIERARVAEREIDKIVYEAERIIDSYVKSTPET